MTEQELKQLSLTEDAAKKQIELFGKNVLPEKEKVSLFILFLRQFKSPFVYILLAVAFISLITGELTDALVIFAVLCLNACIGLFQEQRANSAVALLKKLSQSKAKVMRDGIIKELHTSDVTIDDIVFLEPGDVIPADGYSVQSEHLSVNESSLNGESLPVHKNGNGDQLFRGTVVMSGKGFMKVTKIGVETVIGSLAKDIDENQERPLELQKKIAAFSKWLLIILGIASLLFLSIALLKDMSFVLSLKTVVAMGVAAIPEGLPIVITVVLSIGALQVSKARALLRNLPSGATLASVSTICTDKTGTLTYGDMSLREIVSLSPGEISDTLRDTFLYHGLDVKEIAGHKSGDALEVVIEKYLEGKIVYKETKELPFTSESKFNAKEYEYEGGYLQLYKGAPEVFPHDKELLHEYTSKGLRVLFAGYKIVKDKQDFSPHDVKPLALIVFEDKIREEVKDSIASCQKAGITIIMITGDNSTTAEYVAREVGILNKEHHAVKVGKDLDALTDEELSAQLSYIRVIARVSPAHKERIVRLLQEKGETVAMTGDGVNDGPALSLADIGISMGKSGTDVAREASDLILLNDDFSDIVLAVFEARTIVENIRKALVFLMTSAVSILTVIIASQLFSIPLPLLPIQILWLNFVTAGLIDVAIATEEPEKRYSSYTFTRYRGSLLNKYDAVRIFLLSATIGAGSLVFFALLHEKVSIETLRTALLAVLSVSIWCNAINVRKNYDTVFSYNIFSNKFVTLAIFVEIIVLLGSIYSSYGNTLLQTVKLSSNFILFALVFGAVVIIVDTLYKLLTKNIRALHTYPHHPGRD